MRDPCACTLFEKKKQRKYYWGKKKKHTQKTQVVLTSKGKIVAVNVEKGRVHDFRIFKESTSARKIRLCKIFADLGYLGIKHICPNSELPKKNTKLKKLTKEDKKENRKFSLKRVIVEHINAKIKVFKITKYPYRNRRKKVWFKDEPYLCSYKYGFHT